MLVKLKSNRPNSVTYRRYEKVKEMFPPEKCPKCGTDTVVMHYVNGYRVECPRNAATMYDELSPRVKDCNWFGEFVFDKPHHQSI